MFAYRDGSCKIIKEGSEQMIGDKSHHHGHLVSRREQPRCGWHLCQLCGSQLRQNIQLQAHKHTHMFTVNLRVGRTKRKLRGVKVRQNWPLKSWGRDAESPRWRGGRRSLPDSFATTRCCCWCLTCRQDLNHRNTKTHSSSWKENNQLRNIVRGSYKTKHGFRIKYFLINLHHDFSDDVGCFKVVTPAPTCSVVPGQVNLNEVCVDRHLCGRCHLWPDFTQNLQTEFGTP